MVDVSTDEKTQRGQRLRKIRKMLDLTIIEFAQSIGIGESTIRQWEQGKASGLSSKGAYKIWSALLSQNVNFTADWLMTGEGPEPNFQKTPVAEGVSTPFPTTILTEEAELMRVDIEHFIKSSYRPIVFTIQDNAMEPLYILGDTVGGNCLEEKDFGVMVGQCAIVKTTYNEILIRKIVKGQEVGYYHLYSINPNIVAVSPVLSNQQLILVAPITRVWRVLPH